MKLKSLALAAVLVASAGAALATPTVQASLGDIACGSALCSDTVPDVFNVSGSFEHWIPFTLSASTLVSGFPEAVEVFISGGLSTSIGNGLVQLFRSGDNAAQGAAASFSDGLFDQPLAAGSYYFRVTGTGLGAGGSGAYNFTYETLAAPVTTPVPEPQTVALMLAGLGMVGFLARRRQPR